MKRKKEKMTRRGGGKGNKVYPSLIDTITTPSLVSKVESEGGGRFTTSNDENKKKTNKKKDLETIFFK